MSQCVIVSSLFPTFRKVDKLNLNVVKSYLFESIFCAMYHITENKFPQLLKMNPLNEIPSILQKGLFKKKVKKQILFKKNLITNLFNLSTHNLSNFLTQDLSHRLHGISNRESCRLLKEKKSRTIRLNLVRGEMFD